MWLVARLGADLGVIDLADIEFLRLKSLSGDLFIGTPGKRTTTGTIVSVTPATGKTFFLYKASCHGKPTSGVSNSYDAELQNDSVVKDRWDHFEDRLAGSGGVFGSGESVQQSIIQADKLVGNSAKIYRIELVAVTAKSVWGQIIGWFENT